MKYKIIVAGPVGAGKTTAINSLTNDNAFMTDATVSDEVTSKRKSNTTVAMDFGVVNVNANDVAHVYGTPGQQRFSFMWEILSEGAHGLVILLDNSRNYPFRDLKYFAENFADLIAKQTLILGVTRSDVSSDISLERYQHWLQELNLKAEVRFIDAREKEDVEQLIFSLVKQISMPASSKRKIAPALPSRIDEETLEIKSNEDLELEGAFSRQTVADKKELVLEQAPPKATEKASPVETSEAVSPDFSADSFKLDENIMQQVATLSDVGGVTLTNSYGELLHSTIDDDDMNEFIAFLSGIAPALEEASGMGGINRIMLRGPLDENLTVFVEEECSLGVSSAKTVSVPALSQKIEDMLQWV